MLHSNFFAPIQTAQNPTQNLAQNPTNPAQLLHSDWLAPHKRIPNAKFPPKNQQERPYSTSNAIKTWIWKSKTKECVFSGDQNSKIALKSRKGELLSSEIPSLALTYSPKVNWLR